MLVKVQEPTGVKSIKITEAANGLSAYQLAVKNDGFQGDYAAWRDSNKGDKGGKGDSAYDVWLSEGNTGTVADYIASKKGDKGDAGSDAEVTVQNIENALGYTPANDVKTPKLITGVNLYNYQTNTIGHYVNWTNGNLSVNPAYDATDFIAIQPSTQYTIQNFKHYVFYDSDKNMISGDSSSVLPISPNNAYFIRLSLLDEHAEIGQLELGSEASPLEPYKEVVEPENIKTLSEITDSVDTLLPTNSRAIADYLGKNRTKLNPFFTTASDLVYQPTQYTDVHYESSTFTGWGCGVGVVGKFNAVSVFVRSWDETKPITEVRIRVKENDTNGAIITEKKLPHSHAIDDVLIFVFDEYIDTTTPLWVEYLADGRCGYRGNTTNTDVGQGTTAMTYTTKGDTEQAVVPSEVSTNKQSLINYQFLDANTNKIDLTDVGVSKLKQALGDSVVPRLILPDNIDAVVGYKQQIFYRGIIESNNPYQWNIKITGDVGGKQYPRYYEFTPSATGTKTFTISLYNDKDVLITSATTTINIVNAKTSLPTTKVLCMGDSLTNAGVWTGELQRMVAQTGGSPSGLGLSNFELIGTTGTAPNLREGHSGKTWSHFTGSNSPFWNSSTGQIDLANYVSTNGFGTIDYVYALLTWNGQSGGRAEATDHVSLIDTAKIFLDQVKADFPNVKVKLMGIQLPCIKGGLGDDYGDANNGYGNYYDLVRTVNGLNLAYQELANDPAYSSFVEFVNVSTQFDNENNMPLTDAPVNSRSSTTEKLGTNGVHPAPEGYNQIADVAFRNFNAS
jgi:hypothetical protein